MSEQERLEAENKALQTEYDLLDAWAKDLFTALRGMLNEHGQRFNENKDEWVPCDCGECDQARSVLALRKK